MSSVSNNFGGLTTYSDNASSSGEDDYNIFRRNIVDFWKFLYSTWEQVNPSQVYHCHSVYVDNFWQLYRIRHVQDLTSNPETALRVMYYSLDTGGFFGIQNQSEFSLKLDLATGLYQVRCRWRGHPGWVFGTGDTGKAALQKAAMKALQLILYPHFEEYVTQSFSGRHIIAEPEKLEDELQQLIGFQELACQPNCNLLNTPDIFPGRRGLPVHPSIWKSRLPGELMESYFLLSSMEKENVLVNFWGARKAFDPYEAQPNVFGLISIRSLRSFPVRALTDVFTQEKISFQMLNDIPNFKDGSSVVKCRCFISQDGESVEGVGEGPTRLNALQQAALRVMVSYFGLQEFTLLALMTEEQTWKGVELGRVISRIQAREWISLVSNSNGGSCPQAFIEDSVDNTLFSSQNQADLGDSQQAQKKCLEEAINEEMSIIKEFLVRTPSSHHLSFLNNGGDPIRNPAGNSNYNTVTPALSTFIITERTSFTNTGGSTQTNQVPSPSPYSNAWGQPTFVANMSDCSTVVHESNTSEANMCPVSVVTPVNRNLAPVGRAFPIARNVTFSKPQPQPLLRNTAFGGTASVPTNRTTAQMAATNLNAVQRSRTESPMIRQPLNKHSLTGSSASLPTSNFSDSPVALDKAISRILGSSGNNNSSPSRNTLTLHYQRSPQSSSTQTNGQHRPISSATNLSRTTRFSPNPVTQPTGDSTTIRVCTTQLSSGTTAAISITSVASVAMTSCSTTTIRSGNNTGPVTSASRSQTHQLTVQSTESCDFSEFFSSNPDGTTELPKDLFLPKVSNKSNPINDGRHTADRTGISCKLEEKRKKYSMRLPFDEIIGYRLPQEAPEALNLLFKDRGEEKPKYVKEKLFLGEVKLDSDHVFQVLGETPRDAIDKASLKALEWLKANEKYDPPSPQI